MTSETPTTDGPVSEDGKWRWNGSEWVPNSVKLPPLTPAWYPDLVVPEDEPQAVDTHEPTPEPAPGPAVVPPDAAAVVPPVTTPELPSQAPEASSAWPDITVPAPDLGIRPKTPAAAQVDPFAEAAVEAPAKPSRRPSFARQQDPADETGQPTISVPRRRTAEDAAADAAGSGSKFGSRPRKPQGVVLAADTLSAPDPITKKKTSRAAAADQPSPSKSPLEGPGLLETLKTPLVAAAIAAAFVLGTTVGGVGGHFLTPAADTSATPLTPAPGTPGEGTGEAPAPDGDDTSADTIYDLQNELATKTEKLDSLRGKLDTVSAKLEESRAETRTQTDAVRDLEIQLRDSGRLLQKANDNLSELNQRAVTDAGFAAEALSVCRSAAGIATDATTLLFDAVDAIRADKDREAESLIKRARELLADPVFDQCANAKATSSKTAG